MASQRTRTAYNDVESLSAEIEEMEKSKEIEESKDIEGIEELKIPYKYAIKGNWTGVVHYYEKYPDKLVRSMNLDGDNVLHLAASSCSKSQCQRVLKNLIDLCRDSTTEAKSRSLRVPNIDGNKCVSTTEAKSRSLRIPNIDGNNALHQVSVSGSVEAAKFLLSEFNYPIVPGTGEENNDALPVSQKINDALPLLWTRNHLGETPVHRAAALGHTELVKFYLKNLKEKYKYPEEYWSQLIGHDKMSVLRMAVVGQHFETAYWLLQSYPSLGQMKDEHGLTSLQLLAQMPTAFRPHFQHSQWKMLIYHCLPVREDDVESGMDTNHPRQSIFWKKLAVVMKAYHSLWDSLAKGVPRDGIIYKIWKEKKNKKSLKKLTKLLVKSDRSWLSTNKQEKTKTISLGSWNEHKDGDVGGEKGKAIAGETESDKTNDDDGGDKKKEATKKEEETESGNKNCDGGDKKKEATKKAEETESGNTNRDGGDKQKEATKLKKEARKEVYQSSPLIIATITGNVPIVQEILEQHPQAIEHVNEYERNILHLAIKNRQKKIFDLIKNKLIVIPKLSKRIDHNGNTILHQAADRSYYSVSLSQKLIGPAMQLQDELRWFRRVKEIIPPHYIIHHNKKDQTADELFNYWHDDLLEQAQKWVKETAQSCSTVAVLVATVVFAAAYAIPGGTNDKNGLPLFQNDPLFLLFTSMDVVAIASSLSSVAFFLSVLSSPLDYPLFVNSIPNKVMAGFIFLFISMATTMLAFAATILLLIRVEKKWTKSLLYPIAFFPVPLFGLLQFPMYQSFRVMFHEINAWFFKPLLRFFKTLLYFFLYFLGFGRSLWCKKEA